MANLKRKLKYNVESAFYVDDTCIDCDACRKIAPDIFAYKSGHSYVYKDPTTDREILSAQKALISCPVGSIGDLDKRNLLRARNSLPEKLIDEVYLCGFNAKGSFGADSYFIKSEKGNWLVDSPRFSKDLVKSFRELGGLDYIFLTHRDDVADCEKYAKEFDAKMIIHEYEKNAVRNPHIILKGDGPFKFDDALIIFTPGHTKGHCCLLWKEKILFTGDHFSWSSKFNRYNVFKDYCWYNFDELIESVKKLRVYSKVEWIFPGHGKRKKITEKTFTEVIDHFIEDKFWEK